MKNQSCEIPAYLKEEAEAASEEVRIAAEEIERANRRYYEAIRARIAISDKINAALAEDAKRPDDQKIPKYTIPYPEDKIAG